MKKDSQAIYGLIRAFTLKLVRETLIISTQIVKINLPLTNPLHSDSHVPLSQSVLANINSLGLCHCRLNHTAGAFWEKNFKILSSD